VAEHVRLNVAWSSVVSDVDVLATNGLDLIAVEVKSSRDNLARASKQLHALDSYVDYVYLAMEGTKETTIDKKIGILLVQGNYVVCPRPATRLTGRPDIVAMARLQRICLSRISPERQWFGSKLSLAETARGALDEEGLRRCVGEVVTCMRQCDTSCPIWKFQAPPLDSL
jgi:hypothetical protein